MRVLMVVLAGSCGLGWAGAAERAGVDPPAGSPMACCGVALPGVAKAPAGATIGDLSFLTGDWGGERDGRGGSSFTQEVWSEARGNNMMGMFRWVNADGTAAVFELLTITEEDGTLVLRLRHQDARGRAWEAQDKPATLHLSRLASVGAGAAGPNLVVFTDTTNSCDLASCTYDCSEADRLTVTVAFDEAGRADLVFHLARAGGFSGASEPGAGAGLDDSVSSDGGQIGRVSRGRGFFGGLAPGSMAGGNVRSARW